jgi:hypothetical protein
VPKPGRKNSKADYAIRDHQVVQDREFFFEEAVAFSLHQEKLEGAFERYFQRGNVPGFMDIFIDSARINSVHSSLKIGIGCGQHANDARTKLARLLQQLHAFSPGMR